MKPRDADNFAKRFAEAVKRLRQERDLSHEKLAALTRINRTTISNIEASKKSPTLATCFKIAKGLGVKLSELIGEAE